MKKKILTIFSLTVMIPLLGLLVLEFSYQSINFKPYPFPDQKIWIHRGGVPENSIEGISRSIQKGFEGIEIDVHYIESLKKIILTHDRPTKEQLEKPLFLDEVWGKFGSLKKHWWLDFKNLNEKNVTAVAEELTRLNQLYSLHQQFFIESVNVEALDQLAKQNIPTVFWLNPMNKSRFYWFRKLKIKWDFLGTNYSAVSVYYESFDEKTQDLLRNVPVLLFTVNGETKARYQSKGNVKIILTDDDL